VTLLFTDIEGSTELMERLGERRAFELFRDHSVLVRQLVQARDGSVVKSQGDGFMVAFASSHAGLRCAIDLQRALADPDADPPLRVRVGVHAGLVILDRDDFFGRNVVLAARIADDATGGEILVSETLKQQTETDPSFAFEPLGERSFKGLKGTHQVYRVPWRTRRFEPGASQQPREADSPVHRRTADAPPGPSRAPA
jgi:class 3 adenylate cyclase